MGPMRSSPLLIVTPPSSRFCPWSTLRPPHYAVRGSGEVTVQQQLPGNLSAEDGAMMREIVEAVR